MPPIPLLGGFYSSRSLIANAQKCENLYPEPNPEGSDMPFTCYPTPGLTLLISGTSTKISEVRGSYLSTKNQLFVVIGDEIYYINSSWSPTLLGTLSTFTGIVNMVDNGIELLVVDGSSTGYKVDLSTLAFASISGGSFYGGDHVAYQDTYFILNRPGTNQFYSSDSNSTTFSATNLASKTGYPDWIEGLASIRRELWLLGRKQAGEIWYNSGATGFPFEILSGAYLDVGTAAKYSQEATDLSLYWLGKTKNSGPDVYIGKDYKAETISTYAIATELEKYTTTSDAIGMIYEQGKHTFFMLTFPTQDITWVYDITTGFWHRRGWTDSNGVLHRHRANCICEAYGKIIVGDWQNGNIYSFDLENYTDNNDPIVRRRSFPHLVGGSKIISYNRFVADMDCGNDVGSLTSDPEYVYLRWSDNRGHSYGSPVRASIGSEGQYYARPTWNNVGSAMDRVFEVFWSGEVFTAIQGAWIEAVGSNN